MYITSGFVAHSFFKYNPDKILLNKILFSIDTYAGKRTHFCTNSFVHKIEKTGVIIQTSLVIELTNPNTVAVLSELSLRFPSPISPLQ